MSEFHPNRQSKVKSKLGLTRARLFESWPLLIWIAVGLLGFWGYSRGQIFSRMNGAVDVYQENITPTEDGRLLKILVQRGAYVEPGTVVAEMDSRTYRTQLSAVLLGVAATRYEQIRDLQRQELNLQKEQRDFQTTDAADSGKLAPLLETKARLVKQAGGGPKILGPGISPLIQDRLDQLNADIGEIEGRKAASATGLKSVEASLAKLEEIIAGMSKAADLATKAGEETTTKDVLTDTITKEVLAGLNDSERRDVLELKNFIDLCQLRTTKGGTVDKLEREAGEYAKAGESILRVVADPDQIVGFLPQEQIGALKVGDAVWVTPAQDRHQIFETKVNAISPRINSLADATSPLPNRRLYGRDVVIEYPKSALPAQKGGPFMLVPGQTIIIHTNKPGEVPLINRIFHNDDINAQ